MGWHGPWGQGSPQPEDQRGGSHVMQKKGHTVWYREGACTVWHGLEGGITWHDTIYGIAAHVACGQGNKHPMATQNLDSPVVEDR